MKEQMINALKDTCGGTCLTDPDNCECFGIPSKEVLEILGDSWIPGDEFFKAEDCAYYDSMHYELSRGDK